MKTSYKFYKAASLALIAAFAMSSCATLFSGKTSPVVLVSPPKDLKVSENGVPLSIERVKAQVKSGSNSTTTYYASGVNLSKKQKHHTLVLESGGKTAEVKLRTKVDGGVVFLDVLFTGGLGIIVDASTKKWRKIKSNHVDVQAVLDGTPPRNQRKLKKSIRRQAEGRE